MYNVCETCITVLPILTQLNSFINTVALLINQFTPTGISKTVSTISHHFLFLIITHALARTHIHRELLPYKLLSRYCHPSKTSPFPSRHTAEYIKGSGITYTRIRERIGSEQRRMEGHETRKEAK